MTEKGGASVLPQGLGQTWEGFLGPCTFGSEAKPGPEERRGEKRREGGEEGRGGAAECSHLGGAEERSSIITPTLHPCHDKGERKFLLRPGPGFWRQPQTSRARRSHRRLLLLWHPTRVSKYVSLTQAYALHLPCRLGPARSGRHPRSAPQDGQVQHHAGELPVSTHTLRCTQHALPRRQITGARAQTCARTGT